MDEKIYMRIAMADLYKNIINMLVIGELTPPSKVGHCLLERRACTTREGTHGDMVLCHVGWRHGV